MMLMNRNKNKLIQKSKMQNHSTKKNHKMIGTKTRKSYFPVVPYQLLCDATSKWITTKFWRLIGLNFYNIWFLLTCKGPTRTLLSSVQCTAAVAVELGQNKHQFGWNKFSKTGINTAFPVSKSGAVSIITRTLIFP